VINIAFSETGRERRRWDGGGERMVGRAKEEEANGLDRRR
jgi:hypothetical protein